VTGAGENKTELSSASDPYAKAFRGYSEDLIAVRA
jgi:hypothetical protein